MQELYRKVAAAVRASEYGSILRPFRHEQSVRATSIRGETHVTVEFSPGGHYVGCREYRLDGDGNCLSCLMHGRRSVIGTRAIVREDYADPVTADMNELRAALETLAVAS